MCYQNSTWLVYNRTITIDIKNGKTISCNLIAVAQASSGDTVKHHFAIEDKCQEVGIPEMLIKLYMQDFVEPKTTKNEICDALQDVLYKDKKFIKMMNEETLKIGRHTPLPFRSKSKTKWIVDRN